MRVNTIKARMSNFLCFSRAVIISLVRLLTSLVSSERWSLSCYPLLRVNQAGLVNIRVIFVPHMERVSAFDCLLSG